MMLSVMAAYHSCYGCHPQLTTPNQPNVGLSLPPAAPMRGCWRVTWVWRDSNPHALWALGPKPSVYTVPPHTHEQPECLNCHLGSRLREVGILAEAYPDTRRTLVHLPAVLPIEPRHSRSGDRTRTCIFGLSGDTGNRTPISDLTSQHNCRYTIPP